MLCRFSNVFIERASAEKHKQRWPQETARAEGGPDVVSLRKGVKSPAVDEL